MTFAAEKHGLRMGCAAAIALWAAVAVAQLPPPRITIEDCSQLKGKAKAACQARVDAATAPPKSNTPKDAPVNKDGDDKFAFPEEQSKGSSSQPTPATGDMPTSGVADPPAESMRPLRPDGTPDDAPAAPAGSSSSSSSSSSTSDDDAAPTTSGSDTPVKASSLKDLGSHGDISAARAKLEQTRVEDDLKIGHFYLKDGNCAGAVARYKDALDRDADNPDAHYGLAEVLLKQGKQDEAAAHLRRYLTLAPDEDHSKDARKMLAKLGASK